MHDADKTVAKRGIDLLRDPQLNKSTAFTEAEREALGLTGSCPPAWTPRRPRFSGSCSSSAKSRPTWRRYIYLIQLLDTDETLFYRC